MMKSQILYLGLFCGVMWWGVRFLSDFLVKALFDLGGLLRLRWIFKDQTRTPDKDFMVEVTFKDIGYTFIFLLFSRSYFTLYQNQPLPKSRFNFIDHTFYFSIAHFKTFSTTLFNQAQPLLQKSRKTPSVTKRYIFIY